MQKHLLVDIIQKGVQELKQIADSFRTDAPNSSEINIAISKTEVLLKEFHLLQRKTKELHIYDKTIINNKDACPNNNTKEDNITKIPNKNTNDIIICDTITTSLDLNKLININDKFQFTIELFNNKPKLYRETINKLNSVSSFENAKKIISSFNWNTEDETVIHFYEILTRKFNHNV